MRSLVVLVVLSLCAPVAIAQPAPGPAVSRRERIKKRVLAMRASTLINELLLDEQSSIKLFPVLSKYDAEFEKLLLARADVNRRLQAAANLDPKTIDKLIDEAAANQRGFWDAQDKRLTELRKILTPVQIARLLIVLPALEQRIQNQLRRAILGGGVGAGGGRRGNLGKPNRGDDDSQDEDDDEDDGLKPPGKTAPAKPGTAKPGTAKPHAD